MLWTPAEKQALIQLHTPPLKWIREHHDRRGLWVFRDRVLAGQALELADPAVHRLCDFRRAVLDTRDLVAEDLTKLETDVRYRVPLCPEVGGPEEELWIYYLQENQRRPQRHFPYRIQEYQVGIWQDEFWAWDQRKSGRPLRLHHVVPLVLYTGEEPWHYPRMASLFAPIPELERFIPEAPPLFIPLAQIPREELVRRRNALGWILQVEQALSAEPPLFRGILESSLQGLNELPEEQEGQWLRSVWSIHLACLHHRNRAEYPELEEIVVGLAREARFEVREEVTVMQSMAQAMLEQGWAEGEARIRPELERSRAEVARIQAEVARMQRELEESRAEAARQRQEAARERQEADHQKQEAERQRQEADYQRREAERQRQEADHQKQEAIREIDFIVAILASRFGAIPAGVVAELGGETVVNQLGVWRHVALQTPSLEAFRAAVRAGDPARATGAEA